MFALPNHTSLCLKKKSRNMKDYWKSITKSDRAYLFLSLSGCQTGRIYRYGHVCRRYHLFSFSFLSSKHIYFTSSHMAYYLKIKHLECRLCIVCSYHIYVEGNVSTPLEKKTHFRHSNALYTNGYDASDRVKTNYDEFSIGKRWVTGHNS